MINHEKVFKLARNDEEFVLDIKLTLQKLPRGGMFADTLELGIWAAAYSGWVIGRYGHAEWLRRMDIWRKL